MSYLNKLIRRELQILAREFSDQPLEGLNRIELQKIILEAQSYNEEFTKERVIKIISQRKELMQEWIKEREKQQQIWEEAERQRLERLKEFEKQENTEDEDGGKQEEKHGSNSRSSVELNQTGTEEKEMAKPCDHLEEEIGKDSRPSEMTEETQLNRNGDRVDTNLSKQTENSMNTPVVNHLTKIKYQKAKADGLSGSEDPSPQTLRKANVEIGSQCYAPDGNRSSQKYEQRELESENTLQPLKTECERNKTLELVREINSLMKTGPQQSGAAHEMGPHSESEVNKREREHGDAWNVPHIAHDSEHVCPTITGIQTEFPDHTGIKQNLTPTEESNREEDESTSHVERDENVEVKDVCPGRNPSEDEGTPHAKGTTVTSVRCGPADNNLCISIDEKSLNVEENAPRIVPDGVEKVADATKWNAQNSIEKVKLTEISSVEIKWEKENSITENSTYEISSALKDTSIERSEAERYSSELREGTPELGDCYADPLGVKLTVINDNNINQVDPPNQIGLEIELSDLKNRNDTSKMQKPETNSPGDINKEKLCIREEVMEPENMLIPYKHQIDDTRANKKGSHNLEELGNFLSSADLISADKIGFEQRATTKNTKGSHKATEDIFYLIQMQTPVPEIIKLSNLLAKRKGLVVTVLSVINTRMRVAHLITQLKGAPLQ